MNNHPVNSAGRPTSAHSAREDPRSTLHPIPSMLSTFGTVGTAGGAVDVTLGGGSLGSSRPGSSSGLGSNPGTGAERDRDRERERDRALGRDGELMTGDQRERDVPKQLDADRRARRRSLPTSDHSGSGVRSDAGSGSRAPTSARGYPGYDRRLMGGDPVGEERDELEMDDQREVGFNTDLLESGPSSSSRRSMERANSSRIVGAGSNGLGRDGPASSSGVQHEGRDGHVADFYQRGQPGPSMSATITSAPFVSDVSTGMGNGLGASGIIPTARRGDIDNPTRLDDVPITGSGMGTIPSRNGSSMMQSNQNASRGLSVTGGGSDSYPSNASDGSANGNGHGYGYAINGAGPSSSQGYSTGLGFAGSSGAGSSGGRLGHAQMAARKQNVACDACRGRKVKCNRQPGEDNCESCKSKGLDCTSHYVSQIASYRKNRQATMQALSAASPAPNSQPSGQTFGSNGGNGYSYENSGFDVEDGAANDAAIGLSGASNQHPAWGGSGRDILEDLTRRGWEDLNPGAEAARHNGVDDKKARPSKRARIHTSHRPPPGAIRPNHNAEMEQDQLIAFLLSPTYIKDPTLFAYVDDPLVGAPYQHAEPELGIGTPLCEVFFDPPSPASGELVSPDKRKEWIVHIRHTVLVPEDFRRCFAQPFGPDGCVSPSILALVLAWGAKYSEHPIINEDRQYHSRRLTNGRQRCRIAQMLASRAQQIIETDKICRRPSKENLQALALMGVLVGSNMRDPRGHRPYWEGLAIDQIRRLGYNRRSVIQSRSDNIERAQIGHLFWYTVWADAISSAYYHALPHMTDEGHDIEAMHTWLNAQPEGDSKPSLSQYLTWHSAIGAISRLCRTLAQHLWIPRCERLGIPLDTLRSLISSISHWRDEHLAIVGVPSAWPSTWDFLAASEACAIDCNFHCLWVVLAEALEEHGIKETRQIDYGDGINHALVRQEAEALRTRIHQEALNGSLRISALAGVLASNNYLRLDPDILFHSVFSGGRYLAQQGRKEAEPCIKGLRQLGLAYEEVFDRVEELEGLYNAKVSSAAQNGPYPPVTTEQPMSVLSQALPSMMSGQPSPHPATVDMTLPSLENLGVGRFDMDQSMVNPWFNVPRMS